MKNEYTVTWKLYRSWAIENMLKGVHLGFTIGWVLLGLLCFWFSLSSFLSHFFQFMGLFCFYRAFLRFPMIAKKQYRTLAKAYGQENWTRTILFGEDNISIFETNTTTQLSYSDIVDIREKDDKIWLIFNHKMIVRLYKSAFVDTDWEDGKAAILDRKNQAE